ncbi:MAG TPA: hypothetical protein VFW92_02580 [Candidatus Limnocylindrales bacterium]|nr:hypothetical protein [Candidatus Limnocylindrales bacterium]
MTAAAPAGTAGPARTIVQRAVAGLGAGLAEAMTLGAIGLQTQVRTGGPDSPTVAFALTFLALISGLALMGALLAWLRPGHPIGWLLIAAGLLSASSIFFGTYADLSLARGGDLPATALAAWIANWSFMPNLGILVVFIPLLFPSGRFLTRRWAWFGLLAAILGLISVLDLAFSPGPMDSEASLVNPLGLEALGPILQALAPLGDLSAPVGFGGAFLSLVLRYRRGGPVERRQLRLFVYPMAVAVVALVISIPNNGPLADLGWQVGLLALAAVPVAIAVAIVRYRLFDIDRLISRTVAYGLLTVTLVACYGGVVLALQALLATLTGGSGPLAVAAATLLVAALFQPLRRRLQAAVDRRFDRNRYDAERLVAAFGGRLRDRIELEDVRHELLDVASQALHPAHASLWLRQESHAS